MTRALFQESTPKKKKMGHSLPCVLTSPASCYHRQQKAGEINDQENQNEGKENIRVAIAAECRQLHNQEISSMKENPWGDAQAPVEGELLGLYEYDELKQKKKTVLYESRIGRPGRKESYLLGADLGLLANSKAHVQITPESWTEEQGIGSFLSVAKGCNGLPIFLEIHYRSSLKASKMPLVFVGREFPLTLVPSANINHMRADVGEPAPRHKPNKPVNVIRIKNVETIQVDNIDAERRILLADILYYVHIFNPKFSRNVATLTDAMGVALGTSITGIFTNSYWWHTKLFEASFETEDNVWRMSLSERYIRQVADCQLADASAGPMYRFSIAEQIVTHTKWTHLAIASVMTNKDEVPHLRKRMTRRLTRTLIEFLGSVKTR
ncbi:hypothetical protein HPG69_014790, partial [Diceros bicornis minor]